MYINKHSILTLIRLFWKISKQQRLPGDACKTCPVYLWLFQIQRDSYQRTWRLEIKTIPAAQVVSLPIFVHSKFPHILKPQLSRSLNGQSQPTKSPMCAALEDITETEDEPPWLFPPVAEPSLAEAPPWVFQECFSASMSTVTEKSWCSVHGRLKRRERGTGGHSQSAGRSLATPWEAPQGSRLQSLWS